MENSEETYKGIRIQKDIEIHEEEIPDALKIVLYRLLQEALNNVAKHSHADQVRLLFLKENGRLELHVQDNGQGFKLDDLLRGDPTKRGLGLSSMKERTELSRGVFHIESFPGQGTIIRVSWRTGMD